MILSSKAITASEMRDDIVKYLLHRVKQEHSLANITKSVKDGRRHTEAAYLLEQIAQEIGTIILDAKINNNETGGL